MTDLSEQLDLLEEDEKNTANSPRSRLAWGPPKCNLCGAKLQTLPTAFWRSCGVLITPCPACHSKLHTLAATLRKKQQGPPP